MPSADKVYDYIVVGAGPAGSVLANRLSANPRHNVLLLEAGGQDNYPWIHIPVGYLYCIGNPRTDWCFKTEAQAGLQGRSLSYPRGKVLGGSSSINGMFRCAGCHRYWMRGWRGPGPAGALRVRVNVINDIMMDNTKGLKPLLSIGPGVKIGEWKPSDLGNSRGTFAGLPR